MHPETKEDLGRMVLYVLPIVIVGGVGLLCLFWFIYSLSIHDLLLLILGILIFRIEINVK